MLPGTHAVGLTLSTGEGTTTCSYAEGVRLLPAGLQGGADCPHTRAPKLLEAAGHSARSSGSGLESSGTAPDSRFRSGGRETGA